MPDPGRPGRHLGRVRRAAPTRWPPTSSPPASSHQAKVAAYLYNGPEYLETYFAAFKGGFAPVNTNYRYGPEELFYLFDNADAEAVVFHAAFTELLDGIRDRLPKVRRWYAVADEAGAGPDWADAYESVVGAGRRPRRRARGAAPATTCCCSTPAAPPACPRA